MFRDYKRMIFDRAYSECEEHGGTNNAKSEKGGGNKGNDAPQR